MDRREILLAAGAVTVAGSGLFGSGRLSLAADEPAQKVSPQFEAALAKIIGSGTPEEGKVTVEIPEIAENGNIVPYKLAVESPMTDADYVARIHLLSTANPQAEVATFHFTPLSGKAVVSGRMRLAKTQDVVAIALTSGGKLLSGQCNVQVTIGGCGND